jgi:hypothetical protein
MKRIVLFLMVLSIGLALTLTHPIESQAAVGGHCTIWV